MCKAQKEAQKEGVVSEYFETNKQLKSIIATITGVENDRTFLGQAKLYIIRIREVQCCRNLFKLFVIDLINMRIQLLTSCIHWNIHSHRRKF